MKNGRIHPFWHRKAAICSIALDDSSSMTAGLMPDAQIRGNKRPASCVNKKTPNSYGDEVRTGALHEAGVSRYRRQCIAPAKVEGVSDP